MGHSVLPDREYRLLQAKLDSFVEGAPDTPVFMKILEILFTPGEAEIASRLPYQPTNVDVLTKRLDKAKEELTDVFYSLANRGLVLDLEYNGERYVALSPVVVGFFDFVFMRTRNEIPMAELAADRKSVV